MMVLKTVTHEIDCVVSGATIHKVKWAYYGLGTRFKWLFQRAVRGTFWYHDVLRLKFEHHAVRCGKTWFTQEEARGKLNWFQRLFY